MAKNKAAEELQSLVDATQEMTGLQDSAAVLRNLEKERGQHVRDKDGNNASFDMPNALATGIGAGFILGPIGGAVLGIAQGFLGKKAEQNLLDEAAKQSNVMRDAIDAARMQITGQYSQELSDRDKAILDDQMNRLATAEDMLFSGSVDMRENGAIMFDGVTKDHTTWLDTQEKQKIAENALIRETDRQTVADFRSDLATYDAQTENFASIEQRTRSIIENMNQGDPVSVLSALSQMPLAINDAAGAMTDGEFALWQEVGGWADGWIGKIEKELAGGGGMTEDTRREIIAEAEDLRRRNSAFQTMRDGRYKGRAPLFGFSEDMTAEFDARKFVPDWKPATFTPGPETSRIDRQRGTDGAGNVVERLLPDPGNVYEDANEIRLRQDIPAPAPVLNPRSPLPTN